MSGVLTLVLMAGVLCGSMHSSATSAASIRASKATNESSVESASIVAEQSDVLLVI